MRTKRGMTIVELVIGGAIALMALTVTASMTRFCNMLWNKTDAEQQTKEMLHRAVERMAPDIRAGLFVDATASTPTKLVFLLPKKDGAGEYLVPLQEGDEITFYLSNISGSLTAGGNYLWRAVNDVPDTAWSLRSGKPAFDLGINSLTFLYTPSFDPECITIQVQSKKGHGAAETTRNAESKVFLRNHSYITTHRSVTH